MSYEQEKIVKQKVEVESTSSRRKWRRLWPQKAKEQSLLCHQTPPSTELSSGPRAQPTSARTETSEPVRSPASVRQTSGLT